jgi:integrase
MSKKVKITEVQIEFIKPNNGLIGFASFVMVDSMYISSVAIHSKLSGDGYRLTYPCKGNFTICHPITKKVSQEIEGAIFSKLKEVMKKVKSNGKKPSNRKTTIRRFDPRRIRKGFSYTARDLSEVYGIDESTVHRWVREEGLIPIDNKTPAMFHYKTTKQFLEHKNQSRKMATGNEGDLPCLKCFLKRRAYQNKIIVEKINNRFWNIQGTCSCCGSKMNMRVSANEFILTITWGYELVETLPKLSIIGTKTSSVITTSRKGRPKDKFIYNEKLNFHPDNERMKHDYFDKIIYRFGRDKKTRDKIVTALRVFEEFNRYKDFKSFSYEIAKGFKKYLLEKYNYSSQMSHRTITYVREFFLWLKEQDGYKKLYFDDIKALQLSLKDQEKAKRTKPKDYLDAGQWQNLILSFEPKTEMELRGRAMLACLLLTGMRVEALITLKIGDISLLKDYVFQDSVHVKTKFSSSNKTNFFKFKPEIKKILIDWVQTLRSKYDFGNEDPLFPKVRVIADDQLQFEKSGFLKEFVVSTSIVNQELTKLLEKSNLGHYTPHTIRNSLVALFMGFDLTAEQLKAISQNISHKSLETTTNSYYSVHEHKKDKIIEGLDIERLTKIQKIKDSPKYQFTILTSM